MSGAAGDAEADVAKEDATNPTPRRTRQHVIAAMGLIHVQKAFIDKGHTVDRGSEDYGYDLVANTFDEDGYQEDGDIRIQVKATDTIHRFRRRDSFSYEIKSKHYNLWIKSTDAGLPHPLRCPGEEGILALRAGLLRRGSSSCRPEEAVKTLTVRIPVANEFTEDTVDYMWEQEGRDPGSIRKMLRPWLRISLTVSSARCWPSLGYTPRNAGSNAVIFRNPDRRLMIILPEMRDEEFVLPIELSSTRSTLVGDGVLAE